MPRAEARPTAQATPTMTSWAAMMQAESAMVSLPGWATASTCPAIGSMAALPKWNSATDARNTSRSRRLSRSRKAIG